jgi:hypothetical protein
LLRCGGVRGPSPHDWTGRREYHETCGRTPDARNKAACRVMTRRDVSSIHCGCGPVDPAALIIIHTARHESRQSPLGEPDVFGY